MKSKICKCGDKYKNHNKGTGKCYKCPCKKFEAENHSPQENKVGLATKGSANLKDTPEELRGSSGNQSLSDKKRQCYAVNVYEEEDVKESIKKLKEEYMYLHEGNRHEKLMIDKINKIFGEDLVK